MISSRLRAVPVLMLALALLLAGCGGSTQAGGPHFAAGHDHDVALSAGWVSAVGDMSGMSGMSSMSAESTAYATVTDTGSTDDALVSVSTPAAGQATLHNTVASADGSAGTMVAADSIPVPAGGHVTLQPGGYHVMLTDLKSDLKAGSTITMTWTFRSGATVTTTFPVIDPADRPEASR
jgi:copper(I)-binding protein